MNTAASSATSPLGQTTANFATDFWNDSCSVDELDYAIACGGVGATTNPSIVLGVLKKELPAWRDTISRIIADHPTWGEEPVA